MQKITVLGWIESVEVCAQEKERERERERRAMHRKSK